MLALISVVLLGIIRALYEVPSVSYTHLDVYKRQAQAVALGKLVREGAAILDYTRPFYDLEWVWDGTCFWIVQARPITARGRQSYPALMKQPAVWSRANSRDVDPDPLPALDRGVSLPLINHMLTCLLYTSRCV